MFLAGFMFGVAWTMFLAFVFMLQDERRKKEKELTE